MVVINPYSLFVYDVDALVYFAQVEANAVAAGWTAAQREIPVFWKQRISNWFTADKASGNFTRRLRFHLLYNANEIAAMTSLVNPSQAMWTYGDANRGVFRAYNGVAIGKDGNGSPNTSWIKTKFIPSTHGGSLYTLNNACFGYGVTNNVDGAFVDMGGQDASNSDYSFSAFGGDSYSKLNTVKTGNGLVVTNASNIDANYHVVRENATTLTFYKNNTPTSGAEPSTALMTVEHYLGAFNNNGGVQYPKIANYTWFGFGSKSIDVAANNLALTNLYATQKYAYFYGDSITAGHIGTAAHTPRCWTTLLSAYKGWSEKNLAVGGTSLQNAIPLNPEGTSPNMYDQRNNIPVYDGSRDAILWINYGVNDCGFNYAAYTTANFSSQLGTILDVAIGTKGWPLDKIVVDTATYITDPTGWNTYLVLSPPIIAPATDARFQTFISACEAMCVTKGVVHVSPYAYMAANGGNALLADGVHPNVAGHTVIFDYMLTQNL